MDDTLDSEVRVRRPAPQGRLGRGARIGRYTIAAPLGEGGMGIVYAAYDAELDRKVALKLLHPRHGGTEGGSARERLVREAQAMAKLDHPNVVTVFDVGVEDDRTYVAMELVAGETLGKWLVRTRPRWPQIVEIFLAAGRGLVAAHREGLVHRDFKPDNVMIGPATRVRVMDFGLARPEHDALARTADEQPIARPHGDDDAPSDGVPRHVARMTMTGAMVGTPAYMAPEQFAAQEATAATDQFAFCVALWEALHGQRPFLGATFPELSAAVMSGRIARAPKSAPRWLRRVLSRGLAVEPSRRWPTMDALLVALERGLGRRTWTRVAAVASLGIAALVGTQIADALAVRRAREECRRESTAIDEVWNDAAKDRLRAALVPAAHEVAATTFDHAIVIGDRVAAEWTSTYATACDASVHPPNDEWAEVDSCLADLEGRLAALVDILAGGEIADGVQRLAPMLLRLDAASSCLEPEFRERRTPGDAELQPLLWRVEALDRAGAADETLARATELTRLAEREGRIDLVLRAELLAASAETDRGEHEAAHTRLQTAFDRALAEGDDAAAISAAAALVSNAGVKLLHESEGLMWARIGTSLVARTDAARSFPALRLKNAIGLLHREHGRLAEAERAHLEGLEVKRQLYGAGHPDVVRSLDNLGLVYREQGRIAESIATHREVLALREAALGPDHTDIAITLNNLATALEDTGEYDQAVAALLRALDIRERAFGPTSRSVGMTLNNLGLMHERRGQHEEAERYLLRAQALFETGEPDVRMLAHVHNNLGLVHRSTGRRDRALASFTKTLELRRTHLAPDHPTLASTYNNLGLVSSESGDLDAAQQWYEQALAIYEKHGGIELATTYANLGDVFRQRKRYDDARRSFARSVEVIEQLVGPDAVGVAFGLLGLARVELESGDPRVALRHAARALAARERTSMDPILVAEARLVRAEATAATGAKAEALVLTREALATIDTATAQGWPALREEALALLETLETE